MWVSVKCKVLSAIKKKHRVVEGSLKGTLPWAEMGYKLRPEGWVSNPGRMRRVSQEEDMCVWKFWGKECKKAYGLQHSALRESGTQWNGRLLCCTVFFVSVGGKEADNWYLNFLPPILFVFLAWKTGYSNFYSKKTGSFSHLARLLPEGGWYFWHLWPFSQPGCFQANEWKKESKYLSFNQVDSR